MTLKQTKLSFKPAASQVDSMPPSNKSSRLSRLSRNPLSEETQSNTVEFETIVVAKPDYKEQLPTPSESASDASSQNSEVVGVKIVPQGRAKRVSRLGIKAQRSQNCLLEGEDDKQSRSISGETLVMNMSQSSLVQNGIAALDLTWNMSSVFKSGAKGECVFGDGSRMMSTDSLTTTVNADDESFKGEHNSAKKPKLVENANVREAKSKAATVKVTRRSSRASVLVKASEIVSGLSASVLGKRSREGVQKGNGRLEALKTSLRPRSALQPITPATSAIEEPASKKRRLSDSELVKMKVQVSDNTSIPSKKEIASRKEKRWLVSGLYTGQTRAFDPRHHESKNRSKQGKIVNTPSKENAVLPLPMFAGERLLKEGRDFKLPFDVFSPLPAGQPKPDEWRKTNKNVFVGDAAQFWRTHKYEEYSICNCSWDTGCDSNCMNRFMFYECDEQNCRLPISRCGNRSFEDLKERSKQGGKYNVGVEVIKTKDRGYGVRSNRTFEPNQIIVEYTGEIITQEECEERMNTLYKNNECYYLMLFDQNMIIDATRGSITRFVNHSCEPNCRMEKWTVGGKPRMALFAGERGVMTGDELTYDYNFDPFSQKNVQECRCGSKSCRGVLGPKSKDDRKPKQDTEEAPRAEGRLAGAKRKLAQVLDGSTNRLNKKRKVHETKIKVHQVAKNGKTKVSEKIIVTKKAGGKRTGIKRTPSTLTRMIVSAKSKAGSKRVVSRSSASEALVGRTLGPSLSRKDSVKAKAARMPRNVVRTVKGGKTGKTRTIRPILDVQAEELGDEE